MVGDGQKVKFWKDRRYGNSPSNVDFLSLFACPCTKEAWVGMYGLWTQVGDVGTPLSSDSLMIGTWRM